MRRVGVCCRKKKYIVIDSPSLPSIGHNSFYKLFNLTTIRSRCFSVNIILITNTFPAVSDLPAFPKVIVEPFREDEIKAILQKNTE